MANNRIQIKRSVANATVTGLANGELAFTQASNTLHIGLPDGSGVLRIGGAQYPGTLTNSHALVANSTGAIDKVIAANATITSLVANGSAGSNGQVLVSNGSGVYWGTGTSGSNTYVQFNDSGVANGVAGFTFNKTSNTLSVGNTVSSLIVTANTISVTGNTISSNTTTGALTVAGGLGVAGKINTGDLAAGNDSVYSSLTGTTLATINVFATGTVNGSTLSVGGWVIANNGGVYTSGIVNADILAVGTNFRANTSRVTVGSGVGFSANGSLGSANQVLRSDGTSIYWSDDVGDISTVTAGNGLSGGGTSGDITVNVLANNGIIANSAGSFVDPANGVYVDASGVGVLANSGIVANSSGTWAKAANGISVDSSGINVVGGTGVTVNATGVHIGQPVATTSNVTFANVVTTDLTVNGNTVLGDSTADRLTVTALVSSNLTPASNNTHLLGNNSLRWAEIHASNVHSTSGYFDGTVQISGNLIVSGNVATTNVSTLSVSDPLIQLAANNTTDLLDIGFVGHYNDGSANLHTGLFRDASDGGLYKLFVGSEQELSGNNTVNTAANGFTLAILQTYLQSGGLTTNSTSANLVANSSYSVGIVANTLSLSTALAGTSGGTGLNSYTSEDILVANSSNGFRKLSLGTGGYVLQSNGSALVYDILDGGSF
jgi:hypothetical protein